MGDNEEEVEGSIKAILAHFDVGETVCFIEFIEIFDFVTDAFYNLA